MLWIAAILLVLAVVVALVVWRGMDDGADPTASGSPSLVAVAWQDAHDRVGDDAVVEGPVMDVERSPMNADPADTYLNVGKVFHEGQTADPSRFYFVVPSQYDEAVPQRLQNRTLAMWFVLLAELKRTAGVSRSSR
jgi:hypothetical protein